LNLALKVVEQSPIQYYDWLELLSCLVTVAWYIKSLQTLLYIYNLMPFPYILHSSQSKI